jgi:hypothetical protein
LAQPRDMARKSANCGLAKNEVKMSTIEFPAPRDINGRLFFVRHEVEAYKCELAGLPTQPQAPVLELVPAKTVAAELGIGRRTLGRRLRDRGIDEAA